MNMTKMHCANNLCIKHTEHRGGKFKLVQGQWYCEDCSASVMPTSCRALWDMVTTHGDGQRTHIKSAADMRAYEKKHGVSNQLFNNWERNCGPRG